MDAPSMMETLKPEVKTLTKGVEVRGSASPDYDREVRVEAPNSPILQGIYDSQ